MKQLLNRISRINYLISLKKTGSPGSLGIKVGISERSVYDYLRLMKELGAEIKYSRQKETYYYQGLGRFQIGFVRDNNERVSIAE